LSSSWRSPTGFDAVKARLEADPRLLLEAKPEVQFYTEQSEALSTFIRLLGLFLSFIFSIGAVVGAMITMFASVAVRPLCVPLPWTALMD